MRALALLAVPFALAACPKSKTPSSDAGSSSDDGAADGALASAVDAGRVEVDIFPPRDEVCGMVPAVRANSLPGKKPFVDLDPHCSDIPGGDPFCDQVEKTPDPKRTCFVANDNITRAANESRNGHGAIANASAAWDGEAAPKYLDRIDAHFHLTKAERDKLKANHFVVLDRLPYTNYANAFHDVFQEQLPLFVGVDPILHAVFKGTELALERIERKKLIPALVTLMKKLRAGLAASAGSMSADTRKDLDLYLGVAQHLLVPYSADDAAKLSALKDGDEEQIKTVYDLANSGREMATVDIFGRERMVDFSQLEPRGHYTGSAGSEGGPEIRAYFGAMMWLSRLEFNLVSRDSRSSFPGPGLDPRETPREVADALALTELIDRTGASTELRLFEDIYSAFAGKREDVSPANLSMIARKNSIRSSDPAATDKLKTAIGNDFKRKARTHFMWEGTKVFPTIFTMFGPRIVPDVAPLTRLVNDEVPDRYHLGAGDVGYVLGHDRASKYIPDSAAAAFPKLPAQLKTAREELHKEATDAKDIYGAWLRSVLALSDKPNGVVPSFVGTEAYADHRLNSALVGYAQIRHTFVLLAAQGYDAYGCEIPDAYVEPLPGVFDALIAHVRKMRATVGGNGWLGLERTLVTLASIAHDEVLGRTLTESQKRWLGMVAEFIPNGGYASTSEPPKWTGWYFDMFDDREHGASKNTPFIADYFTLTNEGKVAYLGAEGPRVGVYIVDVNGEQPRAMVGPVAKGFEAHAPIEGRLSDEKVFEASTARKAPWRESYAVSLAEPPLGLDVSVVRCGDVVEDNNPAAQYVYVPPTDPNAPPKDAGPPKPIEWRVVLRSTRVKAGRTSVTLLDHHGDPLTAPLLIDANEKWQVGVFDMPQELARNHFGVEAFHVRVEDLAHSRTGTGPFDYATTPSVFSGTDNDTAGILPTRLKGPSGFRIGTAPAAGIK